MNEHSSPKQKEHVLEMVINDFDVGPIVHDGYYPISLKTSRGILECRYYASAERRRAVVFAGDTRGGWDSPVRNILYPGLCNDLSRHNINCLRIKYRYPENLAESILDVLAGVTFLAQDGVETIGLVGHGFGGAASIQAAAASPLVSTVVSLSTYIFGTEAVRDFRETQSLFVIENDDSPIPIFDSIFDQAHEPKVLLHMKESSHDFNEAAPEVYFAIKDWLYKKI